MKTNFLILNLATVFVLFSPQIIKAQVQVQQQPDTVCVEKLKKLGADPASFEYFCAREIDYKCLEKNVLSGAMTASQALPICSGLNADGSVIITKSTLTEAGDPKKLRSEVQIWSGPGIVMAVGLVGLLDIEKRCKAGPMIDSKGHKVIVHGLGNAFGSALLGWAANKCSDGVMGMVAVSAAREQQKISQGANCEWSSIGWDFAGITSGGEACKWLSDNVTRPEFLQKAAEAMLGKDSSMTILPTGVKVEKSF